MSLLNPRTFKIFSILFFTITLFAFAVGVFFILNPINEISKLDSFNKDSIQTKIAISASIFSLVGIFLLFITLYQQNQNSFKQSIETVFFEMIKIQRENVSETSFTYWNESLSEKRKQIIRRETANSRKVFKIIYNQLIELIEETNNFFENADIGSIYNSKYLDLLKSNELLVHRNINLIKYAQIDILYLIIFFGLSESDKKTIFNIVEHKYDKHFVHCLLNYCAIKPKVESSSYPKWKHINSLKNTSQKESIFKAIAFEIFDTSETNKIGIGLDDYESNIILKEYKYENSFEKYYGGHQFRLGHYFRHLYQSVTYIDKQKNLSYKEKYKYIKILRGQLSNYEQLIFFFNSLSEIGRIWEFETKANPEQKIAINNRLVTKYSLIKNIPLNEINNIIKISMFYPDIIFEAFPTETAKESRKKIEKYYH